ncbi:type III PLP-dependent enzyme [Laceyella putida]|uniref:Type III PLP-dependent enzyme n=1 Tax=Laceyella putida TaxID=110101 RepID=A0ABW2RFP3_9BACL
MSKVEEILMQLKQASDQPLCAYVYDLDHLHAHVSGVVSQLPERCEMYYAMKANSERPILEELAPLVQGFEVASVGEVKKAREVDRRIPVIFGGPGKTDEELMEAIRSQVELIHVESIHELRRLEYLASQVKAIVPVLLRINLAGPFPEAATLHMAGRPTQFGINERELAVVMAQLALCRYVRLEGFHFHSLSNHLHAPNHIALLRMYVQKAKQWVEEYQLEISRLNVGGGIGVNYQALQEQFDWPVFVSLLRDFMEGEVPENWKLMFECGRYLTASCGYYVTEVLDLKENHGERYAVVRGGTHHFRLPSSWQHNHPFEIMPLDEWKYPFARTTWEGVAVTVVGQLCTPKDVMARQVPVDRIRIGDLIIFQYTGAYSWSISHHDFLSHPHPDHIWLRSATNKWSLTGKVEKEWTY